MPLTSQPPSSSPFKVHWLVRMNYRNRTIFDATLFLAIGAHLWDVRAGPLAWGLLVLQFLVHPHVAYWIARRARHPRQAEMRNVMADPVLAGLWIAGLGLPYWIAFTLFTANCINMVVFYGYQQGLLRLVLTMGAAVATVLGSGFVALHLQTSLPTTLLCMVALTLYLVAFAHDGYKRSMEQYLSHEKLRAQFDEIRNLQARLQEQAVRDPLTGLFNRRQLDAMLGPELLRCRAAGLPLSLLMIDIDHFKRINDSYGHAAGDAVLQTLAQVLQRHARPQDVACRYGGEEFVLVLTDTPLAVAEERAGAVRQAFEALGVRHGDRTISATLSCGVAGCPQHADQSDTLIACADEALYAAKVRGRNGVLTYAGAPRLNAVTLP